MTIVKYRLFEPRLMPRRTKMEVPGWAGKPDPRRDGSHEYGWHCMPFVEGAQYGIELFYPFDNELQVTQRDGHVVLEADWGPDPGTGVNWPPFRDVRRGLLFVSVAVGSEGAGRHGGADRAASALLHLTRERCAACGPGAAAHELVADDLVRHLQGATAGLRACVPAGGAVHADAVRAGGGAVRTGADG